MLLKDKVLIITGASRGIGYTTALLFAKEGARCVICSRTEEKLGNLASEIEKIGGYALPVVCDVTCQDHIESLVQKALESFGTVDILINNAGCGWRNPIQHARLEDWDRTLDVNLRGAMICTQKVLPAMIQKKEGTIINISSISGIQGYAGSSAYCASKFGLRGFTQSLFEEVRELGIKVSLICPGYVDTEMVPQTPKVDRTKMLRAEDVAKTCLFVATTSTTACPAEIVLLPQREPER